MKNILAAIVAALVILIPSHGLAAMQVRDSNGTTVTLATTACTNAAALARGSEVYADIARMKLEVSPLMAAGMIFENEPFEACWFLVNGETVGVIVDDGDATVFAVPKAAFSNVEGI